MLVNTIGHPLGVGHGLGRNMSQDINPRWRHEGGLQYWEQGKLPRGAEFFFAAAASIFSSFLLPAQIKMIGLNTPGQTELSQGLNKTTFEVRRKTESPKRLPKLPVGPSALTLDTGKRAWPSIQVRFIDPYDP